MRRGCESAGASKVMDTMPTIKRATYVYPVHYACAIVADYNKGVHQHVSPRSVVSLYEWIGYDEK